MPNSSWLILIAVFVWLETRNLRCPGSFIDDQRLAILHLELYSYARHALVIFLTLPLRWIIFKGENYVSSSVYTCCLPKEKSNTGCFKGGRGG